MTKKRDKYAPIVLPAPPQWAIDDLKAREDMARKILDSGAFNSQSGDLDVTKLFEFLGDKK